MFGFLERAAKREALKLQYQNSGAAHFIVAFDQVLGTTVLALLEDASVRWTPGQLMPRDLLKLMFEANKALRIAYDKTPARYGKQFDQAYRPILGWKEYYSDYVP